MQITAKIDQLLPLQTGEGKNGPWKKQDIIVITVDKFPKKICISCWGDLAENEIIKKSANHSFLVLISKVVNITADGTLI
jgi:hypothetical protein